MVASLSTVFVTISLHKPISVNCNFVKNLIFLLYIASETEQPPTSMFSLSASRPVDRDIVLKVHKNAIFYSSSPNELTSTGEGTPLPTLFWLLLLHERSVVSSYRLDTDVYKSSVTLLGV